MAQTDTYGLGLIKERPCNMKRVVAKLLLEQIGTCLAFSKLDGTIATFAFKDFPMIAPDGSFTYPSANVVGGAFREARGYLPGPLL